MPHGVNLYSVIYENSCVSAYVWNFILAPPEKNNAFVMKLLERLVTLMERRNWLPTTKTVAIRRSDKLSESKRSPADAHDLRGQIEFKHAYISTRVCNNTYIFVMQKNISITNKALDNF